MWYNLSVKSKIIKNCCYGYPNPKTHAYLKNHITFLTGKDGITISARNNTLSSSLLLSNNNSNNNNNKMKWAPRIKYNGIPQELHRKSIGNPEEIHRK